MENSVQNEFISTVSHEMRTPLTSIRGFSQTLLTSWEKISDDDKKKFIKIIEEQSNRLIHLVENILSVSKIDAYNNVFTHVNINDVINKVISMISAQYKDRKIIFNPDKNEPVARLDEDKFQQIMTNLIDNALKYSQKEVVVMTMIKGNKVQILVKDYGVGIKEEDFSKVFQKFCRLENHLTSKTQGNGLGLYITKQITEKLGGKIEFESKLDEGTIFKVEFPLFNDEEVMKCSQMS